MKNLIEKFSTPMEFVKEFLTESQKDISENIENKMQKSIVNMVLNNLSEHLADDVIEYEKSYIKMVELGAKFDVLKNILADNELSVDAKLVMIKVMEEIMEEIKNHVKNINLKNLFNEQFPNSSLN
jgi:hypothetical protein